MTAAQDTYELMRDLEREGISMTFEDANTIRRAQLTLHRWAEQECGNSDQWKSWAIERDEVTDLPYMTVYPHTEAKTRRYRIPDRERGALRRVAAICARLGIYYYHQTDPRGSALRLSRQPLTDADYTRGVAA